MLYQQAIQEGTLPYWNHQIFSGTTHSPYGGSPIHYSLFSTLSVTTAHDLLLFLHMSGMALMMFLYLKELKLLTASALLGAVSWMFNGYLMVWFEFENAVMMALTLPATLYFIEKWFRRHSLGNFLGLSIVLSLAVCAGYAHLLIYQLLLTGIYVIFRHVTSTPVFMELKMTDHARILSGPAAALMVAILAGAMFFSNSLSLMNEGHREDIPFSQLHESTGELPARYLITMIFPDFYGSPTLKQGYMNFTPKDKIAAYPYNNYNELCVYAGIVTLLFAMIGTIYCRLLPGGGFFVITFFICIAMAMGSIIYWPLATYIPGLSLSTPTRILYISAFCITVLAAFGLQILLTKAYSARWPSVLACLLLVGVTFSTSMAVQGPVLQEALINDWLQAYNIPWPNISGALAQHYSFSSPIVYMPMCYVTLASLLVLALLYVSISMRKFVIVAIFTLLVVDQVAFGWNYNSVSNTNDVYPETPGIQFLKNDPSLFRVASTHEFFLNGMWPFNIEDVGGYASFFSRRYGELIHLSANPQESDLSKVRLKQWYNFSSINSPILSMLNTKYLLAAPGTKLSQDERLRLVYRGEMDIYENKQVMERAYFVSEAIHVTSREEAYRKVASFSNEDFQQIVILESPESQFESTPTEVSSDQVIISEVRYSTNKMALSADVPNDGYLVLTTNFHPDWQVSIDSTDDSRLVSPLRANYSLMAVHLKAGHQTIRFLFHSRWHLVSVAVTALTWACLFVMLLAYVALRRSKLGD